MNSSGQAPGMMNDFLGYDAQKRPVFISKKTKPNYYYIGAHAVADWTLTTATYTPARTEKDIYNPAEFPPRATCFDIRLFVIGHSDAPVYFDDVFAGQPER